MRRLLVLRHAKAAALSSGEDFARPLTERGRDDARKVGAYLAERGLSPDRAIYSGATRTRETFEIVAALQPHPFEAVQENALYDASRFLIFELLRRLPARSHVHLVVGHNPGMADIAALLSGEGADRARVAAKFPTAALAVIAFDRFDWSDLRPGAGRLERFVTPADLGGL